MSYKLNKITLVNKKSPIKEINFEAKRSILTNLFVTNKNELNLMKKVLLGKEKIANGRYQINSQELAGHKFVKNKVEMITNDKWFNRLIPAKFILYFSLFFDVNFLRKARIKVNNKKFDYLSYKDSKNDLDDMKLRRAIDHVISQFSIDVTNAEVKLLSDYFVKIKEISHKRNEAIFDDYYVQTKILAKELISIKEEKANAELLLTFYQSLWDKIYLFNELRNSCSCEYNIKYSSNKKIKKQIDRFKYYQTRYVVRKQLKILNVRTSELRILIYKLKNNQKLISKQLELEINKFNKENSVNKITQQKVQTERTDLDRFIKDLRTDFANQQKSIFVDLLADESALIIRKIIFLTHEYHSKVLAGKNKIGNTNEFKILKKHYKNEILSTYEQAKQWTSSNMEKLDIKFDWYLKDGVQKRSLNSVYLKILKAINLNRNNIVFANKLDLLTKQDMAALMNTISKINIEYPEFTFVALTDNIQEMPLLDEGVYAPDAKKIITLKTFSDLYIENAKMFRDKFFNSWNSIRYRKLDRGIEVENNVWNIDNSNLKPYGKIFINPFKISTEKTLFKKDQLPLIVRIKQTNKFVNNDMHFCITSKGHRIHFYSKQKFVTNRQYVIYLQSDSIIESY